MIDRNFENGTVIYCMKEEFKQLRRDLIDRGYVITSRKRKEPGAYAIHIIQAPQRMGATEDKAKIVELLLPVLQQTRAGCDITELRYEDGGLKGTEAVYCRIEHGGRNDELYIDVSADSGTELIKDIIKRIE